jgi:hypothetical protein
LEEESDDSENDEILNFENDGIPNFENDISQMVSMVNISSNNSIRSSVKKEKKKKRSFRGSRWKEKYLWSWLTIIVKVGSTN